jgi:hypothetical protein
MRVIEREKANFERKSDALSMERWEIADWAENRLRQSPYSELHYVFCNFHDGILTLRGRVSSYYLKQLAQVLVGGQADIVELDNQLEVMAY